MVRLVPLWFWIKREEHERSKYVNNFRGLNVTCTHAPLPTPFSNEVMDLVAGNDALLLYQQIPVVPPGTHW